MRLLTNMHQVLCMLTLPATSLHHMELFNRVRSDLWGEQKRWNQAGQRRSQISSLASTPNKVPHTFRGGKNGDCLPTPVYFNTEDSRCKCLRFYLQLPIYIMTTVRSTDRGETWCKHTCLHFIFQQLHSSNKEPPPPAANHLPATLPPPLSHLCRDCNTQVFCWTHKRGSPWMDGLDTHGASWGKQRDREERAWANTGRMLKACFPLSLHVGMTCSPLSLLILD